MKKGTILVKCTKGFVAGVNHEHVIVQFTQDEQLAKKFKSDAEVNRWLDNHVNVGMGMSWDMDVKLVKFQ